MSAQCRPWYEPFRPQTFGDRGPLLASGCAELLATTPSTHPLYKDKLQARLSHTSTS